MTTLFDPISTVAAQLAQYVDPKSTGGAWAASGYGPQGMLEQLAQRLINKTGITNLNDMVIDTKSFPLTVPVVRYSDEYGTEWYKVLGRDVETGNPSQLEPLTPEELRNVKVEGSWDAELGGLTYYSLDTTENITGIYNKNTGALITGQKFIDLDGWAAGEGWTSGILRFDNDNKPRVTTYGADSGDLGKILPAIAILSLPFTLGASSALLGGEAALLAAESGIAAGGAGIAGLEAGALAGLGTAGAAELGGLAALGEGAGAAASVGGAEAGLGSLASNLTVGEVASVISNPTSLITKPLTESITNQIVSQLGLSGAEVTVAKTAVASVVNAGTAELLGGDPAKAALATVGGTAFNAVAGPIIGDIAKDVTDSVISALDIDLSTQAFNSITRGVTNSISTGVTTALAGGDAQDVLINSGVAFIGGALAKEKIPGTKFNETDLEELIPGYFDNDSVTGGNDSVTGEEGTKIVVSAPRLDDITAEPPVIAEPPVVAKTPVVAEPPVGPPEPPTERLEITATRECPPGQIDTEFGCAPIVAEPPVVAETPVVAEPPVGPPEPPIDRVEVTARRECPPGEVDTEFGCAPIVAEPPVTPEPPVTTECAPGFHDVNGLCVADDDRPEETECPEGKVRNLDTGLCEAPKATTCPNGYVLNPTTGRCEVKVGLLALPGAFSSLFRNANSGGGAGYSPNLREKFMATRTYTPPPEDYDYFTDPYFQRFGPISYVPPENYAGAGKAEGGLMSLAKGGRTSLPPRYLNGHSDGMADKVPASIDNSRPAALSDGEFVIPADVVSHLGNGNSNAGAKVLYEMMDRIRRARTGNSKQGKQINPSKFIPR